MKRTEVRMGWGCGGEEVRPASRPNAPTPKTQHRFRQGLSLIELLVSVAIVALATVSVSRFYITGLSMEETFSRNLDEKRARARFEDRMVELLSGAAFGSFVSPIKGDKSQGSLAFTTWSEGLPAPLATEKSADFDAMNQRFGAIGGLTEVAFSTEPAGIEASQRQGLFLRQQRPADTDLTQGGEESLFDERISDISFEFSDGSQWQSTWDSVDAQKGKLPRLVRVSYLTGENSKPRSFLARLPLSAEVKQ